MASHKIDDVETLQHSLKRVGQALHILDAFNHRNKNQHHSSRWWAQFDMLRRSVRKTIPEVEAAVEAFKRKAPVKRFKVTKDGTRNVSTKPTYARAQWLHEHGAPRAFIAFTQLAADNQYAPLGLVLLGVLAQIEAALSPLIQAEGVTAAGETEVEVPAIRSEDSSAQTKAEVPAGESHDFGVAISRDEVLSSRQVKSQKASVEKQRVSSGASNTSKPQEAVSEGTKEPAKPKKDKKKKKKRKGDEFDDLFSSLM